MSTYTLHVELCGADYIHRYKPLKDTLARRPGRAGSRTADSLGYSSDEFEEDPLFLRASRLSRVPEDDKRAEQRKILMEMEARQRAEREALQAAIRATIGYVEVCRIISIVALNLSRRCSRAIRTIRWKLRTIRID